MTNYQDIITRLEAASGPDRELDADIWLNTTEGATRVSTPVRSSTDAWPPYIIDETRDASGRLIIVPSYTASLDASIALVERKLPGAELEMTNLYGVARVTLFDVDNSFHGEDHCNRLQTALLIALFKALQAQEKGE